MSTGIIPVGKNPGIREKFSWTSCAAPLYTRFRSDVGATVKRSVHVSKNRTRLVAARHAISPCVCIEGETVGALETDP
jgi:hypothetical protein